MEPQKTDGTQPRTAWGDAYDTEGPVPAGQAERKNREGGPVQMVQGPVGLMKGCGLHILKYDGAADHREEGPSHPGPPFMPQCPTVGKKGDEPKSVSTGNGKELAKNTKQHLCKLWGKP